MTKKTLELLHDCYNSAAREARNIFELQQSLYAIIERASFPQEDTEEIDGFLQKLNRSLQIRRHTFEVTNLVQDISFVLMYVVIWLNSSSHCGIDINLTVRRKALESELTKFIRKDEVHDLFGIRVNVLNNISAENSKEKLIKLSEVVVGILTKSNRSFCSEFQEWIESSSFIDDFTKQRLLCTLELPIKVQEIKDYINNPKKNGYQSLHLILGLEMYSHVLPGAEVEVQLRTNYMHQVAIHGSASYTVYEATEKGPLDWVFSIDDFDDLKIVGFTSYESVDDDIDGIHIHKSILNRRISDALVYLI